MNGYVDTHCHLQSPAFDPDRDAVIARARGAGVRMLTIGTTLDDSRRCVSIARKHDGVTAAVGIHPNDTAKAEPGWEDRLRELAAAPEVVALGETGLDYYRDRAPRPLQRAALEAHLALAVEKDLPVVLHARESGDDLLEVVAPFCEAGGRAVWHCFVAGKKRLAAQLDRALELGLYLGMSGLVTFEDQKPLRGIVPRIPDRHLLLDTDAPYLLPRPRTMERNEPVSAVRIAEELARLRGVSPQDMARITTRNAARLLGLPAETEEEADPLRGVAYVIRNSLYLSLTNDCTSACTFCARNRAYEVKGHDIRLHHEPSAEEVLRAAGDVAPYDEIVFCGFGEPTLRLETLKTVAEEMQRRGKPVRLDTNGHGNLLHERNIAPELVGRVDTVSVSLNTADPAQYARLCPNRFGEKAYEGVREFVRACVAAGLRVVCTVVDLPEVDTGTARREAEALGADFRLRSYVDVG